jgi:ATP phosphoribosyltransferase
MNGNLKLALQKKGRLTDKSLELLKLCGLDIESGSERLVVTARNFPLEVYFLRDDDIPEYVKDGVADVGIVGENVVFEKQFTNYTLQKLGFGRCSLLIAYPDLPGKEIPLKTLTEKQLQLPILLFLMTTLKNTIFQLI